MSKGILGFAVLLRAAADLPHDLLDMMAPEGDAEDAGLLQHKAHAKVNVSSPVSKTNPMKIYMHYMPWFQSKDFSGFWGYHWKMKTQDPEHFVRGSEGSQRRQVASHFYPLIGAYDSGDPDVLEYHLLLMLYAGIDGVLIDWYGSHKVHDYGPNLENSEALISKMGAMGMKFGIVYEEYVCETVAKEKKMSQIEAAQQDMSYMESKYFSSPLYIKVKEEKPLLLTFGPRLFQHEKQWTNIFSVLKKKISFAPLWGSRKAVGYKNADGEFSWVDFDAKCPKLADFYRKSSDPLMIGSACPGFYDFYEEGGAQQGFPHLKHQNGETLQKSLELAKESQLEYLQLVTWNDFGEGTMIEPTVEYKFKFLEIVQKFTGVPYGVAELELVFFYYLQRKASRAAGTAKDARLDAAFKALATLEVEKAKALLEQKGKK